MKKHCFPIACSVLLVVYWLLGGCANPIPPEGGPKDTVPPRLDSLRSTPNFQTYFKKQTIVLAFDEWVELRDVFNQVVISPPLANRPEIVRRKKTVQIIFDQGEILRDSATYVINFGEAIRDLTEGNVAPVVFVFSTGGFIDSLSVEGTVVDAWTGKPVDNVLLMLYENLADSVVRKDRPFYFARTNKEGFFKVSNVKSGTFKAFALVDQNLNYRFDSDAEQIGFPDSFVVLSARRFAKADLPAAKDTLQGDSTAVVADSLRRLPFPPVPKIDLRIFSEEKPLFLRGRELNRYGQVKFTFSREPYDARITYDSLGQQVFIESDKDTIRLWYHLGKDTTWNIYLQRDTTTDTVSVKSGLRDAFLNSARLVAKAQPAGPPVRLPPGRPFSVAFNHPLADFDPAAVLLLEDTMKSAVRPRVYPDTLNRRNLLIDYPWKGAVPYELQLLPGCVTDIFGLANADSTSLQLVGGEEKDYGSLNLRVKNLSPDTAYVIRLLDKETVLHTFRTEAVDSFQVRLNFIAPSTYTVEVIEDLDRNGRWTTGSYNLHRQPERVYRKTLEQLRANWELDTAVDASLIGAAATPAPSDEERKSPGSIGPAGRGN